MNKNDQWNYLSDFLSSMIIKYADVLDVDSLSIPSDDIEDAVILGESEKSKQNNIRKDIEINNTK
ncbi:MAG: hypothetical protein R3Y54_10725 [Eubacteriales bacterium]